MPAAQCRTARWLAQTLWPRAAYACADLAADFSCRRAQRERRAIAANLSLALGSSVSESSPLVRDVFRNFGRYLVDFFRIHRAQEPNLTIEGSGHLAQAHRVGKGVLLLSAHLGNWELGAVMVRRMGFPVAALVLPHQDPGTDRIFNAQRERCGVVAIPLGAGAVKRAVQWLRVGGLLGILGDMDLSQDGLEATVCGRPVSLPRGPAVLSIRTGAPVVPVYLIREGPGAFRLCIEPPIWPSLAEEGAVARLTGAYAAVLERYVRRFPDQWLLFQQIEGQMARGLTQRSNVYA